MDFDCDFTFHFRISLFLVRIFRPSSIFMKISINVYPHNIYRRGKNSRPPILACVWILCLKTPLFALLTHAHGIPPLTSLSTTTTIERRSRRKKWNIHRYYLGVGYIVVLNQHSTTSWCCDCLLLIVFDLFWRSYRLTVGVRTETLTRRAPVRCHVARKKLFPCKLFGICRLFHEFWRGT